MARTKKKKFSIKKTLRLLIPLIIIIILIISKDSIITLYQSKVTGYTQDTINTFHKLNIYKEIRKNEYSKTLEKAIENDVFNSKYLNEYLKIKFQTNQDFLKDINTLLSLGYNAEDINVIYESLSQESINILKENKYLKDIVNILKLNYFKENNLKRYITYNENEIDDYEELVTYVNIGLDQEYYTNVIKIENPEDELVLVNKYHSLSNTFIPSDLEAIDSKYNRGNNNKLRHNARIAFEKMCEAALKDNIKIYSGSAYRSYNYQLNLYNRYVAQDGKAKAETYSARAGYSEHQTGLATDIMNAKLDYISSSDKEYDWLVNNSYKYGFNLRYPKDKENITGYMYEEWHFRYLGVEVATKLYEQKLTYDEYVARSND